MTNLFPDEIVLTTDNFIVAQDWEVPIAGFHLWMFPRYEWMKEFGAKIESVRPIMKYAQGLEITDELLAEVKEAARLVREYFKK